MIVHSQRLRIERTLSEGPDAAVHLARDQIGGSTVVLRQMSGTRAVQRAASLTQFRLLSRLSRSGFTAPEDMATKEGIICGYATAFVDAPALSEVLSHDPSPDLMIPFFRDLSLAIAHLHSLGYVHCDLKPANVLVRHDGSAPIPCVIDLGLAVPQGTRLPTEWRGTPGYLAPEVVHGDRLTVATDAFSFGIMLQGFQECCSVGCLSAQMRQLGDACTESKPEDRPQSFWQIFDRLDQLSRRLTPDHRPLARFLPPLRPAGINRRLAGLDRGFSAQPSARVGLVAGVTGVGKSTVLREYCLRAQIDGAETIRITGLQDIDDLTSVLSALPEDWSRDSRDGGKSPAVVVAETATGASIPLPSLVQMARLAREGGWRLLIEYSGIPPLPSPRDCVVFTVPRLGVRECIHSTSHLVNNPALASVHGRAIATATGGIPALVTHAMATFLATPYRVHAEPLDFDKLPHAIVQYWQERLATASATDGAVLARASLFHRLFAANWVATPDLTRRQVHSSLAHLVQEGWLVEARTHDRLSLYSFAARGARNTLRLIVGEGQLRSWAEEQLRDSSLRAQLESVNPLEAAEILRLSGVESAPPSEATREDRSTHAEDDKLRLLLWLRAYSRGRNAHDRWTISQYRILADGFRRLGSPRRSRRWAVRALRSLRDANQAVVSDAPTLRDIISLCDLAGDPIWKAQWLEQVVMSVPNSPPEVHGYLLSERGATYLVRTDPARALEDFRAAEIILGRHAPTSRERARNLSRLGVTEAMVKNHDLAQGHLKDALALAQRLDLDDVVWRAAGNLGWLAWSQGDPKAALNYHRQAAVRGRRDNNLTEYLLALSNIVLCLVDLGRGYGARQAARLAVELAEVISDPVQLGHAANNLGFVLAMQGSTGMAMAWFATAIRVRDRIGDQLGAARSQLNIARAYAVARLAESARRLCERSLRQFELLTDEEGVWDCHRLLARIAIETGAYEEASRHLALIPAAHSGMPAPDRVEADLLRAAVALWTAHTEEADKLVRQLGGGRLTETIHGLHCEFLRVRGHWHLVSGRLDEALTDLSAAAQEGRRGSRTDKLVETLTVLALLARRMKNYSIGLRYLRTAEQMVVSMQTELT